MDSFSGFLKNLKLSPSAESFAEKHKIAIRCSKFEGEQLESRIVKLGVLQTSIAVSTTESPEVQQAKAFEKLEKVIKAAAADGVNVLCLPEMWCMPYPFYTPEEIDWREFAESADDGSVVRFLQTLAAKFKVLIISPILENDNGAFYNACVIISTGGEVIGKCRKSEIPPIESRYIEAGPFDNLVFETEFGKIGILICYERHFPLKWMLLGMNGAEIVFNPSAEDGKSFSERLWLVEARNAAAANGFFTVAVNRCGNESFESGKAFDYFGSSYVASPDGFMTEPLPRNCDGLLIAEIDLNSCQRAKEEFSFHSNQHLKLYAKSLAAKLK